MHTGVIIKVTENLITQKVAVFLIRKQATNKNYKDKQEEKRGGKPQESKLHFPPRPSSLKERRFSGKDKKKLAIGSCHTASVKGYIGQ
jgi:hypothetical protein